MFGLISVRNLESIDVTTTSPKTPQQWLTFAQDVVEKYTTNSPADPIIPGFLILGSNERARDRQYLTSLGVTDVLAMALNTGNRKKDFEGSHIKFKKLVMLDTIGYAVIGRLRSALHYVVRDVFQNELPELTLNDIGSQKRRTAANGHCLFVHCLQGISRSMSFVMLFLMYIFFMQSGEAAPDVNDIVRRIQLCRKSCPNTSFQSQLALLQDCLMALIPCWEKKEGCFAHITDVKEARRMIFDISMAFCEAYFETKWRSLGECIAYSNITVEEVISNAQQILKLGLSAWGIKSSPLRQSSGWLRRTLTLDNLSVYSAHHDTGREIADMDAEGEEGLWKQTREAVRARFGDLHVKLPKKLVEFQDIGGLITTNLEDEGGLLTDVSVVSERILAEKHRSLVLSQIKHFQLPKHLLWYERDRAKRQARLRWCMGFEKSSVPCDTGKPWDPIPVIKEFKETCDEASQVLAQVEAKFECRNWSVWLITRAHALCKNLSTTAWNWLVRYESHRKAETMALEEEADRTLKIAEAAVEAKKKRLRFEDASTEELRRELKKLRRKLERLKQT